MVGKSAITAGDGGQRLRSQSAERKKVKQPEQMLGRKTMEVVILRDAPDSPG